MSFSYIGKDNEGLRDGELIREYDNEKATAVAQWLRCCATNRRVAGSIPDGIIGIFH